MRVNWLSVRRMGLLLVLIALLVGCVKIGGTPSLGPVPTASPAPDVQATANPLPTPSATPRPAQTATPVPTATPTAAPTATPDDGSQVIEVALTDSLLIQPDKMTVTAGTPVRFVVTNEGALVHDFFIGSDKEQKTRETLAGEPGKNRHLVVQPGETAELTLTFDDPGKTIAGCTIPGHYSNGMKANITIREP